ncbi:XdhC family protein [Herbiconiux moechotypicola]|uniref:XdhC family protein n=1 Tax=Herbiconiux moechotypicola TaxID=637393 RepID=A0ABP5R1J2_9MICO|nr:XdhC/CoxI family protein [Herbiconiux moechotypicola]MCS5731905.1 XdhC family protein [Herbiconiux moechotypicola]
MLELAAPLLTTLADGRRLAVATVIEVDGSAPRALGTSMAVDSAGSVIGSISGGCVEGAVYDACTRVLESGDAEVCSFGFSDDDAFAVGLACGGRITVFVQELGLPGERGELSSEVRDALERAAARRAAGLALVLDDDDSVRMLTPHEFAVTDGPALHDVAVALDGALASGRPQRRELSCDGALRTVVLLVSAPPPRLILFGAVDFSVALSAAAQLLGYRVTVCDARPVFATAERFPGAEVVNRWPADYLAETEVDERTVVCILTHDDKFDVPLIETALALPVAYVGAMGSRRTHDRRVAALRERGLGDDALASLHSPIGLDLGASSPEETAVSILAEVLATRTASSGRPLRSVEGPIHRLAAAPAGRPTRSIP